MVRWPPLCLDRRLLPVVDEAEQEAILTPLWHRHAGTNDRRLEGIGLAFNREPDPEVLSSDKAPIVRGHDQACPLDTDNLTTYPPLATHLQLASLALLSSIFEYPSGVHRQTLYPMIGAGARGWL